MNALFPDRWQWMEKAREAAFGTLPPDLRGLCASGSQPLVALCGPTQVGKSTLAVLLAGVATPHIDPIVRLLRGGRPVGASATPVPCVYQRAPGSAWRFSLGPGQEWETDEKDAESVIARLREKMKQRAALGAPYLRVQIPRRYFVEEDQADLPTIVDLPGVEAKGDREREAADAFVTQTLPVADVILLVSSQLRYFSELSVSQEPLLNTWLHNKGRFRIVVTRVVSNASIAEKLVRTVEEGGDMVAALRSHYLEQLNTYRPERDRLPLENYPQLYPLEYGDSWAELGKQSEGRELFLKAQAAMAVLVDELKQDVRTNVGMAGQIAQFYQMRFFIKKSYDAKIQDVALKLAALEKQKRQRHEQDVQIGNLIRNIESQERTLERDLTNTQRVADGVQYVRYGFTIPPPGENRSPRALLRYLGDAEAYLVEQHKEYERLNPGVEVDLRPIMAQYQSQIKEISGILHRYVDRDNYGFFGVFDGRYGTDLKICKRMVEKGCDSGWRSLEDQVQRWAEKEEKSLVAKGKKGKKQKQYLFWCLEESRNRNIESEDRIREGERTRDALIREKDVALENAMTIRRHLDDCYLSQFRSVKRELGSYDQALLGFARLLMMRQDFKGLMAAGGAHE